MTVEAGAAPRPTESAFQRGFATFAECLLTGVWIALAALPLLTLPAALAAGARHLRRHLDHEDTGRRHFTADLRCALRGGGWWTGLAGLAAAAVVRLDLTLVRAGLPGGELVALVSVSALLVLGVAGLRAAVSWRPGGSWAALVRQAAPRTLRDPAGSFALVCGFGVVAASAWFAAPLAAPALGVLAAAALAVERRRAL